MGSHCCLRLLLTFFNAMSPALSCQEVTEDDVLDASCLLEVLRMYRWQISSFEEQVIAEFWLHCPCLDLEEQKIEATVKI